MNFSTDIQALKPDVAIRVEQLAKRYRLGSINHGTLARDLQSWWARATGKEDPNLQLVQSGQGADDHVPDIFWALRDLNFDVKKGDVVGIIGRNGAGKSTFLKILSRVTLPTLGEIKVAGRIASLLEVGTGFHPELTGRENIYLNGAILGMSKSEIEGKFDEIVAFSEVGKFLDTPVKRYSSGMYVRLAFSVAAHLDPDILIIDEVLAVGDAQFQKKCLNKLKEVGRDCRTVLFVSHNMGSIQSLCNRCILLDKGEVVDDGTPDQVIRRYLQDFDDLATIPAAQRDDRNGKGLVRFVKISLTDEHLSEIRSFKIGETIDFVFEIDHEVENLHCKFTIYNNLNIPIASFESGKQAPSCKMACEVRNLALNPGSYRINAALYVFEELQDHLESALLFNVDGAEFMGKPVYSSNNYSLVMFPSRWD